ncbi:MAG: NarK/NasA family nitrate transporter [Armatimonadetes bacterium]|nr:NarK/NasA family nitrate transporter [Armatimonadota bacterium]
MNAEKHANRVLFLNTLAFLVCFAAWTLYAVLITYLQDHQVVHFDKGQIGWLIGIPILTGSILRLPIGILADKIGGKPVYIAVMVIAGIAMYLTSYASDFTTFLIGGLAFGISGASFAVGVAYTSLWFPKAKQGTALGLFGMGNIGTAVTALLAPKLLDSVTRKGEDMAAWRQVPQIYAGALIAMAVIFALLAVPKKSEAKARTMGELLKPLANVRVWRFGLYYFVLFGGFVAISQWLIPYYLNVYGLTVAAAGAMSIAFSIPSAVTRALGGFLSDRIGARSTLYIVFSVVSILFLFLVAPKMEITSPGEGLLADKKGVVTAVSNSQVVAGGVTYNLKARGEDNVGKYDSETVVWPVFHSWQEPSVKVGDTVTKKQILARGLTHVYFQANRMVFSTLLFIAGIMMGLGMAAVYKHIPTYFPNDIGAVGGMVGVLGGLGGFVFPIIFGQFLKATGLWTSCWFLIACLSLIAMAWMHFSILKMQHESADVHEADEIPLKPVAGVR